MKRNRPILLAYLIFGIIASGNCQKDNLTQLVRSEFKALELLYNDNITLFTEQDGLLNFPDESKITFTTHDLGQHRSQFKFTLYEVVVPIPPHTIISEGTTIPVADTAKFYVLFSNGRYFKVFGFYASDMRLFRYHEGNKGLEHFVQSIVSKNLITKNQGRLYTKYVNGDGEFIPSALNKPCEVLRMIYGSINNNQKETRSLILPLKPLIEISF
jgi:hypothetical protein